jgi:hypothetical protein
MKSSVKFFSQKDIRNGCFIGQYSTYSRRTFCLNVSQCLQRTHWHTDLSTWAPMATYCPCFRPGCSQQNEQWIWSSLLTWGKGWRKRMGGSGHVVTTRHPLCFQKCSQIHCTANSCHISPHCSSAFRRPGIERNLFSETCCRTELQWVIRSHSCQCVCIYVSALGNGSVNTFLRQRIHVQQ